MPPPQHTPFGEGSQARAVQAYAYHLIGGGQIQGAERAAEAACPGCHIPDIATHAQAAMAAGRAFGSRLAGQTTTYGGRQYAQYAAQAAQADVGAAQTRTATVAVRIKPGGVMADVMGLEDIWKTFQVDIPFGASLGQAETLVRAAARDFAEGSQADYPGALQEFVVRTVIGH